MIQPRVAMVLAAGRGERLRPLTDRLPKPMVAVAGKPLLDHALDRLEEAGVDKVIVNVSYLADQIVDHLSARETPKIIISREAELLDTGGGVVNALPLLGDAPFYVVNGDSLWLNGKVGALTRLARAWDDDTDAVLLLHRTVTAVGFDGHYGDFTLDQLGMPQRRIDSQVVPYVYTGVQLVAPRLFRDAPTGKFSTNRLWDRALAEGRLRAVVHDGEWHHISTVEGLELVEARFEHQLIEK